MTQAHQQERLSQILGGKYLILCRIGGGGMAQVYLARHRLHGGLFAVKVLAEHLAQTSDIVARFEQEARMAASLGSHPNIVPVFDIGEGDGLHYLIMQFILGEDLASYLRREGRVTLPAAANAVAQAAEALSCAEAKHIVHRDLKLANMLLDEGGRVRLLDFGISKITDISDGLTRPGESLGTPFYMSPEQIRGEPCDIRSDLYSLGVVFFELLSGKRPFESESVAAIQVAHLTTPPPSLLALDPSLPQACDAIVQKMLAKHPEDRYQTTAELLKVLFAYGADAGPSVLRPRVAPELQQVIEHAQKMPLERSTLPVSEVPTPAPAEIALATPATSNLDATGTRPKAAPVETAPVRNASMSKWIAGGTGILILLAVCIVVFLMVKPKPAKTPTASVASGPPTVYSDTHGRMLLVPAGTFIFGGGTDGSDPENVTLPAYYVDETEVSNAEYRRFCEATGHTSPQTADYAAHPDDPVGGVSYGDAAAYAMWAGKRLPSEEEWEKAARGTDGRTYPWGNTAWTDGVPNQLQPVTSEPLRRSPYGAYNMAGNVWEWTSDPYTPTAADNVAMKRLLNGESFSAEWRIIKGGSFSPGGSADFSITKHRGLPVDARSPWIGIRCVRSVEPRS
jgi:eukaryotic-like serine/threonine-protein kinase